MRISDWSSDVCSSDLPAEVESAIMGCPGVADVAVIGVPDDKWGEAVKALIVPVPGAAPDPGEVIAWVRERIAAYKTPKSVDFLDALPRTPSGKVLRARKRVVEGKSVEVGVVLGGRRII